MQVNKKDKYVALVLFAFIIFWGWQTTMLSDRTMRGAPGPKFFPWVILGVLTVLAVILFVMSVLSKDNKAIRNELDPETCRDEDEVPNESEAALDSDSKNRIEEIKGGKFIFTRICHCFYTTDGITRPSRVILAMVTIYIYIVAIEYVGFYLASIPVVIILLKGLMGVKSIKMVLLSTVSIIGVIYLIFTLALKLTLPTGSLW